MLDPAILKDNLEVLESNISRRNLDIDVNHLISLNEERKSLRFNAEQKRSQQKELGKQIANADKNEKEELLNKASELSDEEVAPLMCAASTITSGLDYGDFHECDYVIIQGCGALGMYACAFTKQLGGKKVIAIDVMDERLELAKQFGADHIINAKNVGENLLDEIMKITEDRGADVIIEITGEPSVIKEGIKMLRVGGTYILLGAIYPNNHVTLDSSDIITKCLKIVGMHNYHPEHLKTAIDLVLKTRKKILRNLVDLDGIGETQIASINNFFLNNSNIRITNDLIKSLVIKNFSFNFKDGKFSNKRLMFTGGFQNISRSEAKAIVEKNGGKVLGTISKKLDFLVVGDSKPTKKKIDQAKDLNIKIILEKDWNKILNS